MAEREAIQAVDDISDETINELLRLTQQEPHETYIDEEWITDEQFFDAFDRTETLEEPEDAEGVARASEAVASETGGNRQGRGGEAWFFLAGQTNAQSAEQFAHQHAEGQGS